MRLPILSKPKIERKYFLHNEKIDDNLISEFSFALDSMDIEKIKIILKKISKTNSKISEIPATLGISRAGFYKMLSTTGNPEFITILRLLNYFGIKLSVKAEN